MFVEASSQLAVAPDPAVGQRADLFFFALAFVLFAVFVGEVSSIFTEVEFLASLAAVLSAEAGRRHPGERRGAKALQPFASVVPFDDLLCTRGDRKGSTFGEKGLHRSFEESGGRAELAIGKEGENDRQTEEAGDHDPSGTSVARDKDRLGRRRAFQGTKVFRGGQGGGRRIGFCVIALVWSIRGGDSGGRQDRFPLVSGKKRYFFPLLSPKWRGSIGKGVEGVKRWGGSRGR